MPFWFSSALSTLTLHNKRIQCSSMTCVDISGDIYIRHSPTSRKVNPTQTYTLPNYTFYNQLNTPTIQSIACSSLLTSQWHDFQSYVVLYEVLIMPKKKRFVRVYNTSIISIITTFFFIFYIFSILQSLTVLMEKWIIWSLWFLY